MYKNEKQRMKKKETRSLIILAVLALLCGLLSCLPAVQETKHMQLALILAVAGLGISIYVNKKVRRQQKAIRK